jgi:tRNA(Ile)-lysidine synthase
VRGPIGIAAERFARLPAEVALRLLGRAIAQVGDEGSVELAKLESLAGDLDQHLNREPVHSLRFRRTLAGAVITLRRDRLTVERAPARRNRGRLPHPGHKSSKSAAGR